MPVERTRLTEDTDIFKETGKHKDTEKDSGKRKRR